MSESAKVVLSNNTVDARKVGGGIVSWYLEHGPFIDPANKVTPVLQLTSGKLICETTDPDSPKKEYILDEKQNVNFQPGVVISWSGPNDDKIVWVGEEGRIANWKYKKSDGKK